MSEAGISFDQVVAPLGRERFLAEYWTRKFLHQQGAPGRFAGLMSWDGLSRILTWHSPPQPQLRLIQEGAPLDMRRYIDGPVGNLRLNAGNLIALLAQGAQMILDAVNEVSPAVSDLAASMEAALDCPVAANLHAGWRSQRALELGWEPQEIFILQLAGRKRWQVFAPTRQYPLANDVEGAPSPGGKPIWEGILKDGDLLYLPRGCWHGAMGLDEASLHLSLGAEPAGGVDFLQWWMRELRDHAEFRQAFTPSDAAARKAYMERLLKHLEASAARDPLGAYLSELQAGRRARPRLRLPDAPVQQSAPPDGLAIRLATQNALHIEHPEGQPMARFVAAGQSWFIRPEFIAVFQRLSAQHAVPFANLAAMVEGAELRAMLAGTLDSLATAGVLFKEGDADR